LNKKKCVSIALIVNADVLKPAGYNEYQWGMFELFIDTELLLWE